MDARPRFIRITMRALAGWLLVMANSPVRAEPSAAPAEMCEDAELTDIVFLDADRGFAVGDRGVIWATDDGGRTWNRQRSGVSCRLESISFANASRGWIVGGWTHPYSHKTTGVVLQTHDGGEQWSLVTGQLLPALHYVKFLDSQRGVALGAASPMFPAGMFQTHDGGRSWNPLPRGQSVGWLTGDFRGPSDGSMAGRNGELAILHDANLLQARTPSLGPRHLRRLSLAEQDRGWLVGDGGLLLTTTNGGVSWQHPRGRIAPEITRQFDFRALAVRPGHCWVAGSPGSSVLHSSDHGETWEVFSTGQSVPVRALTFLDEQRGWAAGGLGTILTTRDGGRTWRRQRSGGTRVAWLGLFSEPQRMPAELVASISASDGYLGAMEFLCRRDLDVPHPEESAWEQRAHEAVVSAGGSFGDTAWRFPLRQAGLVQTVDTIVAGWDAASDGHGADHLIEHVTKKIRQWRPDVIVTERASPAGEDPLAHLTNQIVLQAVERAADRLSYPEQIVMAGMEPWSVKKVYCVVGEDEPGTITLTTSQLATRLGRSLVEQASDARGLIHDQHAAVPPSMGFRLVHNRLPEKLSREGFFSGITLPPGGEARRTWSDTAGDPQLLAAAVRRRRNLEQLMKRSGDALGGGAWLGQVDDLTKGMQRESAGAVLHQLATRYHHAGQSDLAAEAFGVLIERYPDHVLSEQAAIWLIQYHSSGEVGLRLRRATHYSEQRAALGPQLDEPAIAQAGFSDSSSLLEPAGIAEPPPVQVAGAAVTAAPNQRPHERASQAVALGRVMERTNPALFTEPALRFPLSVAFREQGLSREADRYLHSLSGHVMHAAWEDCARAEQWLTHATGNSPKPISRCPAVSGKPRLDGNLDDEIWKSGQPLDLKSTQHDDETWPCVVVLVHDDEYLYVGINSRKPVGAEYPTTNVPRPRDADLNSEDRVDLLIDLDRDYASYYQLSVDHRGWTYEACFGDPTWNPTWYVASQSDEQQWSVEAAIPLQELAGQTPRPRTTWAVGVQRVIPGVGFQSWTEPAAVRVRPEGFGLLIF